MPDDQIEDHVGVTQPDAFEQTTPDAGLHGKHLYADPKDGKEKEANLRSHHAGASSEAPASSGIPSAMTQSGVRREAVVDQEEAPAANKTVSDDTIPEQSLGLSPEKLRD